MIAPYPDVTRVPSADAIVVEARGAGVAVRISDRETVIPVAAVTELCARLLAEHNTIMRRGVQ